MTFTYWFIRAVVWSASKIVCKTRSFGREHIPESGPVIVAANHLSYLDPPIIGAEIWRECVYISRHDLWNNKLVGAILTRINCIPVHRDRPDRVVIKRTIEKMEEGKVLLMFPEGGRSEDGDLRRGEMGLGLFAKRTGAPIIPAAIIGPEMMLPVGQKKLKKGRVRVYFGEPLTFDESATREEIVLRTMREIAALLTKNGRPMIAAEDRPAKPDEKTATVASKPVDNPASISL